MTNQLKKFKNTKVHYDFNIIDIKLNDRNSRAFSKNTIINAKILIAADGKNSQIKKRAKQPINIQRVAPVIFKIIRISLQLTQNTK